jgi:hypothetical protein
MMVITATSFCGRGLDLPRSDRQPIAFGAPCLAGLPNFCSARGLAILWKDYKSGALAEKDLETAAFNVFLYGRMIGAAAEIDDHLNRGRNMDTRTPQERCAFVV